MASGTTRTHLSAGGRGLSHLKRHFAEDGHHPALTLELLTQPSTGAAQKSCQQVLIASAELTVLQVVLQQPEEGEGGKGGAWDSVKT